MARQRRKFSPEFKDEAIKMAIEGARPIAQVARELGITEGTLEDLVNAYRREHPAEEIPLTVSERARLRELEMENREVRMKNEFLRKAALDSTGQGNALGWCREPQALSPLLYYWTIAVCNVMALVVIRRVGRRSRVLIR